MPHFELLEFKDWWEHLSVDERSSIDVLFCIMKDLIKRADRDCLFNRQQVPIPSLRYSIYITLINKSDLVIEIKIKTKKLNTTNGYKGLDKFTNDQIQALLDCFIKELIVYSNFKKFNNPTDLKFYSLPILIKGNTVTIISGVKNEKHEKLNFRSIER